MSSPATNAFVLDVEIIAKIRSKTFESQDPLQSSFTIALGFLIPHSHLNLLQSHTHSITCIEHPATMGRNCAGCGDYYEKYEYSKNQWRKGDGLSRCDNCVSGGVSTGVTTLDPSITARRNNAHRASFTSYSLDNPFAEGAFRWVAKGKYTHGERAGQPCVCKWFKTGSVVESHFYASDIEASKKAVELISQWNEEGVISKVIQVNLPQVWTFEEDSDWAGQKVLQEPFILNYQKFNSNTGWADDDTPWPRAMQALSHYSYHVSGGSLLLCDLQGGVYRNGVVLTDPVVMSQQQGRYGPTDLGPNGISSFFANHTCNEFCRGSWRRPSNPRRIYRPTAGTTMESVPRRVPTIHDRPFMTAIQEY